MGSEIIVIIMITLPNNPSVQSSAGFCKMPYIPQPHKSTITAQNLYEFRNIRMKYPPGEV